MAWCNSKEAAHYESKHGGTLDQIVDILRARLDFIGVDWAVQDDDDDNEDKEQSGGDADAADPSTKQQRPVKLLDYACGTGVGMSALCLVLLSSACVAPRCRPRIGRPSIPAASLVARDAGRAFSVLAVAAVSAESTWLHALHSPAATRR
jgi:hypothetical protein